MKLILGTAQLTTPYGVLNVHSGDPALILGTAHDLGIDTLDTAPSYGSSEECIGRADPDFKIHTKFDPQLDPLTSLIRSTENLRVSSVEVAYIHDPEFLAVAKPEWFRRIKAQTRHVAEHLGSSVYTQHQLNLALRVPEISVVQIPVSILNQHCLRVLREGGAKQGKIFIGRSIFAQGILLADKNRLPGRFASISPMIEEFHSICNSIGRCPLEVAVVWARDETLVSGLVVGVESRDQLLSIANAFSADGLDAETLERLEYVAYLPEEQLDARKW